MRIVHVNRSGRSHNIVAAEAHMSEANVKRSGRSQYAAATTIAQAFTDRRAL